MNGAIYLVLLLFSIVGVPILMFRRMRKVRDIVTAQSIERDRNRRTDAPYADEVKAADGLSLARPMHFDEELSAADKRQSEMPDFEKTIIGKR